MKSILRSNVPGFKGQCVPTWINNNQIDRRLDQGITGFIKLVKRWPILGWIKHGEEFHGIIRNGIVETTECSAPHF